MSVRSKRLFGPTAFGTGGTTVYTCPPGETAVLKSLRVVNTGNLTNTVTISLIIGGVTSTLSTDPVPAASTLRVDGAFIVLGPGDSLRFTGSLTGGSCAGFGAELEGVAD